VALRTIEHENGIHLLVFDINREFLQRGEQVESGQVVEILVGIKRIAPGVLVDIHVFHDTFVIARKSNDAIAHGRNFEGKIRQELLADQKKISQDPFLGVVGSGWRNAQVTGIRVQKN